VLGDVDDDGIVEIVTGCTYIDGTRTVAQLAEWAGTDLSLDRINVWVWGGLTNTLDSVAIGDVDADGQIEIVTGGYYFDGSRNVAQLIAWSGSDLAVEQSRIWYWVGDTTVNSVTVGDVDGDGQAEIVTGGSYIDGGRSIAQLIEWTGVGLGVDRLVIWSWGTGTDLKSVAISDVDGDGQAEVLSGGYYSDSSGDVAQLMVWSGSSLSMEQAKAWYWIGSTSVNGLAAGDVNGDFTAEAVCGGAYFDGTRWIAQLTTWGVT
jgi:hypothetical protein